MAKTAITERLIERLAREFSSPAAAPETMAKKIRRALLDPIFNALGRLVGWILLAGGIRLNFFVHEMVLRAVVPAHWQALSPKSKQLPEEMLALLRRFQQTTGQNCAYLILFSHPEPGPLNMTISLALYQNCFRIGRLLHQNGFASGYPHLLMAIDPFALDTMDPASGSFYAGFAHTIHFSLDRQPGKLSWAQRVLLKKSAHTEAGFRFVNHLKPGQALAMAPAGGEPQNARILYTAREFATRLGQHEVSRDKTAFLNHIEERGLLAGQELSRLRAESSSWSERETILEALLALLSHEATASGKLDALQQRRMEDMLLAAGLQPGRARILRLAFEREFERHTPYRERLFKILLDRILARGIPLMLIPFWHRLEDESLHLGSPEILWSGPDGRKRLRLEEGARAVEEPITGIAAFAQDFITRHFPR
jgi:hypothetical protein